VCYGHGVHPLIAIEILLLLGFQALFGYVYQQLAVVIAAFHGGMALGAWLATRSLAAGSLSGWAMAR